MRARVTSSRVASNLESFRSAQVRLVPAEVLKDAEAAERRFRELRAEIDSGVAVTNCSICCKP
jgi:uncharacterized protein YcgI (DUF1989 family)